VKRAARVDENQKYIVKGLRAMGVAVQPLHAVGQGCPDLLVGYKHKNYLIEIKNPDKPKSDQKLTKDQIAWHKLWTGQVAVARSLTDAIAIINGEGHDR
jgi:hypothetical protein